MFEGEKVLITGASGKVAFPIARKLAEHNEVWGVARLRDPVQRDKLESAGIRPVPLDVSEGDFTSLPGDFDYVFHAAVDTGVGDWRRCVETNAQVSGDLMVHCGHAKASSTRRRARPTRTRASGPSTSRIRRVRLCEPTTASRRSPVSRSARGFLVGIGSH